MPKFTVTGPDGKNYTLDGPEGATQEDANREVARQHGWDHPSAAAAPADGQQQPGFGDFLRQQGTEMGEFFGAIPQGVLDIPEALYQIGEHTIGLPKPPEAIAEPLRRYRKWAGSTWPGVAGETVGGIGTAVAGTALAPEVEVPAAIARFGAPVARAWRAASPAVRAQITSVLSSQLQPVEGGNFWMEKGKQALIGLLLGRLLGRPAQQAAHDVASTENVSRAAQDAADVAAHKAQVAADVLSGKQQSTLATTAAKQSRKAAQDIKAGVPDETTLRWQKETLDRIGLGGQAPTAVTPEASARVQKLVGDRLNTLTDRMRLDPKDPSFTEALRTAREEASQALPESARAGWYKEPVEKDLPGLILDPTTGRPLARTTRAGLGEPPKATGDFQRTVMEPLEKGELSGRSLTDYISRLGARAEELARQARVVPQDKRAELMAQSNALRQVEDAVIGHAAGDPADKTALEAARKAYSMWSIGNDAGRASQAGTMTPARLIQTISRRMGEARYKQALADPKHPDSALYKYLQDQLDRHTAKVPSEAEFRARQPTPPAAPVRTPPTPRPQVEVPRAPQRPRGGLGRTAGEAALAVGLGALHHPYAAVLAGLHAGERLLGHRGARRPEGPIERQVRRGFTKVPRAVTPAAAAAGTVAGGVPRDLPSREEVARGASRAAQALSRSWLRYGQ